MNINKLIYFIDLVELGSFTKVAEKNFVSQTNITKQIKALEEYFECQLIDRSKVPVSVTEIGQIFYQYSISVIESYKDLEKNIEIAKQNQTKIRIGYSTIMDLNSLISIQELVSLKGNIHFDLQFLSLNELTIKLIKGEIDLAIGFDSEFNESHIDTVDLYSGEYNAVIGENHELFHEEKININKLYEYPLIMLKPEVTGKSYYNMLERAKMRNHQPQIERVTDDIYNELFFIYSENLIGFFPDNYPENFSLSKSKSIPIIDNYHKYKIQIAINSNNKESLSRLYFNRIKALDNLKL